MATSTSDIQSQFTSEKLKAAQDAKKATKANGTNPSAQLDKDAFLKLLLVELQYQDPTSPMDTEKMLTQTSQLATLEMQENTNSTMKELVGQLKTTSSMYSLAALGKMASIGSNSITTTDSTKDVTLAMYFPNAVKNGTLQIKDTKNQVVKTMELKDLAQGVQKVVWDLKDDNGNKLPNGSYSVTATYTGTDGKSYTTQIGNYPVEAVKFVDGKAQVKIAGEYVSIDKIAEFYDMPSTSLSHS
ncbi:flagellar basal body rod modification protein [Campylobacter sp. faydin G-24]|uniref:Basal-body rod modification protein FlgD n=1 Tax=Campylobacter anatolicus TaxID=2829105 RepID=A0ABS5HJL8_9BACT|nr:flagellar basal body rod modification protein [Campylobacter anatolicus]MBR8464455.1 flagellar basal body rod modification protein [Campylobacter anatolicus]